MTSAIHALSGTISQRTPVQVGLYGTSLVALIGGIATVALTYSRYAVSLTPLARRYGNIAIATGSLLLLATRALHSHGLYIEALKKQTLPSPKVLPIHGETPSKAEEESLHAKEVYLGAYEQKIAQQAQRLDAIRNEISIREAKLNQRELTIQQQEAIASRNNTEQAPLASSSSSAVSLTQFHKHFDIPDLILIPTGNANSEWEIVVDSTNYHSEWEYRLQFYPKNKTTAGSQGHSLTPSEKYRIYGKEDRLAHTDSSHPFTWTELNHYYQNGYALVAIGIPPHSVQKENILNAASLEEFLKDPNRKKGIHPTQDSPDYKAIYFSNSALHQLVNHLKEKSSDQAPT